MPSRIFSGLLAAATALLLAAPASAAGPATVTVRVEGADATLVPRTTVPTTTNPVVKDGNSADSCTGTSGAGALERVTGGAWTGTWYSGLGYAVDSIEGENPSAADPNNFWTFWVNNKESQTGICGTELQQGDEVLFFVSRCEFNGSACANPPVLPLGLSVPARATPGAPFTARVVQYATDGTASAVAGATISGGGVSTTTGADGSAEVTVSAAGPVALRATHAGNARSATETTCVTTGADGACGTTPPPPCATNGRDGLCGTRDLTAPLASILGIREGQRFGKGKGPRTLRGGVGAASGGASGDPSGLLMVKLRLTRNDRGHCAAFSSSRERFVARPCGASHGWWFRIGDRADWSYLLPARLPAGRYVLDVNAIDRAYNRDTTRVRGRNRVVFTVG